ncbi:MAG: DUF1015 family protein [Candidatus Humimicrobiaceae bacterium]
MVDIKPLKGLKYNIDKIGNISEVLAPPYDIIPTVQNEELKNTNSFNFSFLTLPQAIDQKNKYENANDIFTKWINEGILVFENDECFYLIEEIFTEDNNKKSFFGLVGLLQIEEYGKGKVLRHEKTLPKPKEDRLNLLSACRANFEFIYTLYDDNDKKVFNILSKSIKEKPLIETYVQYDTSLKFKLWCINNKNDIKSIKELMKPKTLLIADGHHRYETSRFYNESINRSDNDQHNSSFKPEKYILSFFVAGNQDSILIHPTHRLINFENILSSEDFLKKVEKYFKVELIQESSPEVIEKKIKIAPGMNQKKLAVCFKNKKCFLLSLNNSLENIYEDLGISVNPFDNDFEYLDVNILHKLILENIFKKFQIKEIKYIHTITEAINGLNDSDSFRNEDKSYDVCFILNAPSIKTVEKLSVSGQVMPQKSTYFYPKPCSGLVMYKMDR